MRIVVADVDERIEAVAHRRRQTLGHALRQQGADLLSSSPHRAAQHRVARGEDVFVAKPTPRSRQQRARAIEPQRLVLEGPREPFSGGGVERAQTQVLADAPLMCGDRLLPAGVDVDRLGVGAQLQGRQPQDLPVDLQGCLSGESAEHTHEGDLVRETQPVVGTPPQGNLAAVGEATASGQAQPLGAEGERERDLREAPAARRADERPQPRRPPVRQRALAARPVVGSDREDPRRSRKAGVAFVAVKENIRVEGKRDIQTKVLTTLFALFAEVERDLISERTREGLATARASGRKLARPKGSLGVSRLDGKDTADGHLGRLAAGPDHSRRFGRVVFRSPLGCLHRPLGTARIAGPGLARPPAGATARPRHRSTPARCRSGCRHSSRNAARTSSGIDPPVLQVHDLGRRVRRRRRAARRHGSTRAAARRRCARGRRRPRRGPAGPTRGAARCWSPRDRTSPRPACEDRLRPAGRTRRRRNFRPSPSTCASARSYSPRMSGSTSVTPEVSAPPARAPLSS